MEIQDNNQNKKEEEKEVFLWEYLKLNQRQLSVFGILITVTTFSYNLPIKVIGYFISGILLFCSLIVWAEATRSFPRHKDVLLLFFIWLMNLAVTGIFIYWILEYRLIFNQFSRFVITVILLIISSRVLPPLYKRLFKRKGKYIYSLQTRLRIGLLIFISCIVFFSWLSKFISPSLEVYIEHYFNLLNNYHL